MGLFPINANRPERPGESVISQYRQCSLAGSAAVNICDDTIERKYHRQCCNRVHPGPAFGFCVFAGNKFRVRNAIVPAGRPE
jgi:hypothetical protein